MGGALDWHIRNNVIYSPFFDIQEVGSIQFDLADRKYLKYFTSRLLHTICLTFEGKKVERRWQNVAQVAETVIPRLKERQRINRGSDRQLVEGRRQAGIISGKRSAWPQVGFTVGRGYIQ